MYSAFTPHFPPGLSYNYLNEILIEDTLQIAY